jgi:hypothetical protein
MEQTKAIFYKNIYGTDKASEIRAMMLRDFNKIKSFKDIIALQKKYMPYIYLLNSPDYAKQRFFEVGKVINETNLPPKYKNALKEGFTAPIGFYSAINELRELRLNEKNENNDNKINFDLSKFDEIISNLYEMGMDKELKNYPYKIGARQTKEDIRAYYLATYLALTTGRRLIEILKSMELRKYRDKLKIKGIAKKGDENKSFDLITLDDHDKILNAWRELRKIFDTTNLTNRQVNQKYNARFNDFLKNKIFPNSDLTFHDLRKIYLLKAYEKFGNNENFDNFAEKALLHDVKLDAKFLTQTSHYTNAQVNNINNNND